MKNIFILVALLTFHSKSFGQNTGSENCYEIKYLDFFGLANEEVVKWPDSEIDALMATDFEKDGNGSTIKTNFIIPLVVYQLKRYHPDCKSEIDIDYFNKISRLYFKIRDIDLTVISDKSIVEKIDFMRNDFYEQVKDEKYLAEMMLTFDDGPFYGVDFNTTTDLDPIKTQNTNFGFLSVSKVEGKTIMTSRNTNGEIIWQKSITGLYDKNLSDLHFTENPIEYNSVATIAHMYSEGERLTLYLKKDGRFMYYYHSW